MKVRCQTTSGVHELDHGLLCLRPKLAEAFEIAPTPRPIEAERDALAEALCKTSWISNWYERADAIIELLAAAEARA